MRSLSLVLFLLGCAGALCAADTQPTPEPRWEWGDGSLLPRIFQANPRIEVMIVTELTPAGRKMPVASLAMPVYYSGEDGGQASMGDLMGGDPPPKPADLAALMTRSLRAGGFVPAAAGHRPTIYVYYRWGSFNKLSDADQGSGKITRPGAINVAGPMDPLQLRNLMQRAALVGGTRFAYDWSYALETNTFPTWERRSPRNSFLVQVASDNIYFIIATACDYDAAVAGKVVVLWQTRISTSARGVSMDASLPEMAACAATYLGHETGGPVRLDRPEVKDGKVEVGEPVVVREELPPDAPSPPAQPPGGR